MRSRNEVRASLGLLVIIATAGVLVTACGGGSDSEVASGGRPASGGTTSNAGNSNDSAGTSKGGSSSSGSGSMTEGGSGASDPGPGEDCEARESWTEAMHYTLDVTWPGTTAGEAGSGKIEIWSRGKFTATGDTLEIGLHACGSVLPETKLSIAGQAAAGGEKVLIQVPDAMWDAPSVPITMGTGKQSGFGVGSDVEFSYLSLLGVNLADPMAAWPEFGADIEAVDVEGDGSNGYTATPKEGGGFVLPPTAIGILGTGPKADKVYLVSRQGMALKGKRTACDVHSGTAEVSAFDNHVVGCHVKDEAECTADQSDFVDRNRMRYMVTSATYQAKVVDDDASCADVRAALP